VLPRSIALFLATAILLGSAGAGAEPKNQPALAPAGAAGIRAAQGASDRGVLIASGVILAGIVAALLLIDNDDDDTVSTGSN